MIEVFPISNGDCKEVGLRVYLKVNKVETAGQIPTRPYHPALHAVSGTSVTDLSVHAL